MKRKDNKGRTLKTGEMQLKDGRYAYRYVDSDGCRKTVYSWRLTNSDRVPAGKKDNGSLRDIESDITMRIGNGDVFRSQAKVRDIVESYSSTHMANTARSAIYKRDIVLSTIANSKLAGMRISDVRTKDAKDFVYGLYASGVGHNRVLRVKNLLCSAYNIAIEDELTNRNPFSFRLIEPHNERSFKRGAIDARYIEALSAYCDSVGKYKMASDIIVLIANTGLRLGELMGLTISDVDTDRMILRVNKQMQYDGHGVCGCDRFYIVPPKTSAGNRTIPMTARSMIPYLSLLSRRNRIVGGRRDKVYIDGVSGFLILSRNGKPMTDSAIRSAINTAVSAYRKDVSGDMPNMTPHILRHTFCTNIVNAGVNLKTVQYIMGHESFSMSMDVYAHSSEEQAIKDIASAYGK